MCGNKCRASLKSHHLCRYRAFSTFLLRDPKWVTPLQLHLLYVVSKVLVFFMAPSESLGLFYLPSGLSSLPNIIASFCSHIPYLCNRSASMVSMSPEASYF